jgi:hypothetical protein
VSETEDKTFRIRTIEVKKGVAFESGRIHNNISFGLVIDINDEQGLNSVKHAAEATIDGWLTRALNEPHKGYSSSNNPLSFDPETSQWNDSAGRLGPLQLISISDEKTSELQDKINSGTREFGGYTYWIFRDKTTIGRRKIA